MTFKNLRISIEALWRSSVLFKPFFLRVTAILLMILKLIVLQNFMKVPENPYKMKTLKTTFC